MPMSQGQNTREHAVNAEGPGGPLFSEDVITSSGIAFRLWRLYQHAWLACLFFPLLALVREPLAIWRLVLGLVFLLGFAASYTWLMWPHPASRKAAGWAGSRLSLLLFATLSLLVLAFTFTYGLSFLWLLIGVSALAGVLFPMRSAFAIIALFTLLPLFLTVGMTGGLAGVDWWWLIALMLLVRGLGLDMMGVARMGRAIRELHTARRELARLAVIEERERLARDLHDLLGQALSMISLKSELASCLIEEDPKRCAQELSEIEHVSRKTLREVREAVAGYRQPTLISELEGARQLLEAAGIHLQIESLQPSLPSTLDAVLAWTVREGVTNMIRHSRAQQCCIHLKYKNGRVSAEILNDGGERRPEEKPPRRGSGLAGLRKRILPLGGTLEAGPLLLQGKEHFRLYVELPCQTRREAWVVEGDGS